MIKVAQSKPNDIIEFIADSTTDVSDLPSADVGMGSYCFVIEDSSVYMFGSDGTWHPIFTTE